MKRTRILALVLAVAVMMMGAGYAAWTDTLTITHTVSTGELDVMFGDGTVDFQADNDGVAEGTGFVTTDANDVNSSTATVTLSNLYPGAVATVTIPVENIGSIPAKLSVVTDGEPTWLTVVEDYNVDLAVGDTDTITLTMTVINGDEVSVPELSGVQTFTVTATFDQFNY